MQTNEHQQPVTFSAKKVISVVMTAMNPGMLAKAKLEGYPWPVAFVVSGLAFALFFLQIGIELYRAGNSSMLAVFGWVGVGIIYGTLGVCFLSVTIWSFSKLFKGKHALTWTLQAFALSYAPTLVYVVLGLIANLIWGWNTALVFGVTGVLWALIPLRMVIYELVEGKGMAGIFLTTICGVIVLFSWVWL